jgi:hypothetical protein
MRNWNKQELAAYTLLYAAHCNLDINNHEKNIIISKVEMDTFQHISDEFKADNDFQSIQKIVDALEKLNYSKTDLDLLFIDIKTLFLSDGNYDAIENQLFNYLKKILTNNG